MASAKRRTGICLVRVETQSGEALITVRLVPDIEQSVPVTTLSTSDVEAAVGAVRAFLTDFVPGRGGNQRETDESHPPEWPPSS